MKGHFFRVPIDNVSIGTAAQDIFSVKAAAGVSICLRQGHLESTQTALGSIRFTVARYYGATVTQGSGGTAPTPGASSPAMQGNHTASYHINDTTQATATSNIVFDGNNPDMAGPWDYVPESEDAMPRAQGGQMIVVRLPTTLGAAVTISGYFVVEEAS